MRKGEREAGKLTDKRTAGNKLLQVEKRAKVAQKLQQKELILLEQIRTMNVSIIHNHHGNSLVPPCSVSTTSSPQLQNFLCRFAKQAPVPSRLL
jgi:hypothetical protein